MGEMNLLPVYDLTNPEEAFLSQALRGRCILRGAHITIESAGRLFVLYPKTINGLSSIDSGEVSDSCFIVNEDTDMSITLVDGDAAQQGVAADEDRVEAGNVVGEVAEHVDHATPPRNSRTRDSSNTVSFSQIGGLDHEIQLMREMVDVCLHNPQSFEAFGIRPPKGLLLYGPPGTGKTTLVRALAHESSASIITVNGAEVVSKFVGESESRLKEVFDEARRKAPSIIFIDEVDSICQRRDTAAEELQKRLVTSMLVLMDGIDSLERVFVIGATNRPNALDDALRRPGRFDKEVEIGIPSAASRSDILRRLLSRIPHSLDEADIEKVAETTHGYVGADLKSVCSEAAMRCIRRAAHGPWGGRESVDESKQGAAGSEKTTLPVSVSHRDHHTGFGLSQQPKVSIGDLRHGLSVVKPSGLREVLVDVPRVRWSDIGGQETAKQQLREAVEWPLLHEAAFRRLGVRAPRGILLYGPPGCSKTMMAKALANESSRNFIAVKGPELFSKWVGDSEKAVQEVFRRARAAAPAIVFFDEIDAIAAQRGGSGGGGNAVADRVLSQVLIELDGVHSLNGVTIVAATNRPDIIDPALLRPGRIDRLVYISPPNEAAICSIMGIHLQNVTLADDVQLSSLASAMSGFSGAEVVAVCKSAGMHAMEEDIHATVLHRRHFETAIHSHVKQITPQLLSFYDQFRKSNERRM